MDADRLLVPPGGLAGRDRPDASIPPGARLDEAAVLRLLEASGAWVRVETADGERWWVDRRRLIVPSGAPATGPPGPPAAGPPASSAAATPKSLPPPRGAHLSTILIAGALAAVVIMAVVAVVWSRRDDGSTTAPTTVRGAITLEMTPTHIQGYRETLYVAGDGRIERFITIEEVPRVERVATTNPSEDLPVAAMAVGTGVGEISDIDWYEADPMLFVLSDDGRLVLFDEATLEFLRSVDLGAGCCAPVVAVEYCEVARPGGCGQDGLGNGRAVVFPERDGRSEVLWSIDSDTMTIEEHRLPEPMTVTTAAVHRGYLVVGGTDRLLVFDWSDLDNVVQAYNEVSVDAIATPVDADSVDADTELYVLDTARKTIIALAYGAAGPGINRRISLSSIVGDGVEFRPTMCGSNGAVYVVSTDGRLHVISARDAGENATQRHLLRSFPDPAGSAALGEVAAIGYPYQSPGDTVPGQGVIVSDPANDRVWWIGFEGEDRPDDVIETLDSVE